MESTGGKIQLQRFSTSALKKGKRIPFWSDYFASVILDCDLEVANDHEFNADASLLLWPDLHALWSKESHLRYKRTRFHAADGNETLVLLFRRQGFSRISQRGKELVAGPGEAIAFLGAEPATADVRNIDSINLAVPIASLHPMVRDVSTKTMKVFSASNCEALRLLASYVDLLRTEPAPETPEVRHIVARHIHDLIVKMLGGTRDGTALAESRGVRAARMRSIKSDIFAKLGDSALTVGSVALRQQVSVRYIHMLFEAEGQTFSEFVLKRRLNRAYRLLQTEKLRQMLISEIAFAVGFGDLSYFNRTFRRQFGLTPSEVRNAAMTQ